VTKEKEIRILNITKDTREKKKGHWLLDSGCNDHMTYQREAFEELQEIEDTAHVADGIMASALKLRGLVQRF